MSANTGLGLTRRDKQCSYCARAFARSEHLSRHERSHRNERPFRCTLCHATFTRQDVFRRHHARYHMGPFPQHHTQGNGIEEQSMSMHPRSRRTPSPITSSAMAPNDTESLISMTHPPATGPVTFVDTPTVSSSTPSLNFPKDLMSSIPSNLEEMSQGDSGANLALRCLTPPLDNHTSTASSSQVVKSLEWKGSFAISEQQWHQLASEQQWHHLASTLNIVRPVENLNDLKIPSRLTLERLLRAFAECFLIYIPCIHMPTWKAELAPPCMIFAMASIGASYYDDDATATSLHCIAQMCIKNHIELSPLTIADEPLWVLQCLLLIMANGTKNSDFRTFQESASLASLLIEGIQYRKVSPYMPESDGGNDDILQQWQKWIDSEMTVRTICAVYVYLGALGATFHTASYSWSLDINDCFLPCEESEWTSISPQAWLDKRKSISKPPIQFSTALAHIMSGQGASPLRLSIFGSYLTLHGIVKHLTSLYQDNWLIDSLPAHVQRIEESLTRWRMCAEQNPEFHCSPRYPSGVIAANALSLYRQAHVRLCGNFRPLRAALTTRNVQSITSRLNDIQINISSSRTCVKAAWCAIEALQISIVMGMAQAGSISGWHSKLLFNTYSLECCE
ncbi:hypothetical protein CA14_004163 [Aspergillus flavus]|uniref:C2H2-type domain-containing protein n=1 Tax=Aspergillus flavus TaxID=5059 RepID=A0AB74CC88_ASPFL|nr:hypothetical protein CA14_004163 [Aspergillus flavus]